MNITGAIEKAFKRFMPSPFTIAIILTLLTMVLAFCFTNPKDGEKSFEYGVDIMRFWESGIWNNGLLVFAYQMMLILVLGHILVLTRPVNRIINKLTSFVNSSSSAVMLVSFTTILVAFFNWGLGLIFGAILARKVGEHAQQNNIPINYPLVGASGYVGLMVWHGGMSGSAPLKVAESGHLSEMIKSGSFSDIPELINTSETIFSLGNLVIFSVILVVIPLFLKFLSKRVENKPISLPIFKFESEESIKEGAEKLDYSRILALSLGIIAITAFLLSYGTQVIRLNFSLNSLNFLMFGLAILLHGNFHRFLKALEEAIKGTSGILIQFPLYFGIMGIMKESGMVGEISDFFVSIANETTMPIFTFFSAGLVNIFVPSGGGQWAVQGPIVIESAMKLGVPLPKAIMALAYGDQITNMLQPFWALPLLGITKLKAKEILPYTLLLMLVGGSIYILGLILL